MREVKRWLAVSCGPDAVKLLPQNPPACGPDVFVKLTDYDALLSAARKVTCKRCGNRGAMPGIDGQGTFKRRLPCSDCADLRKILGGER